MAQGHPGALLAAAFRRIEGIVFAHGGRATPTPRLQAVSLLGSLVINIVDDREDVSQLGDDESYLLTINTATVATLAAPRLQGALHGLPDLCPVVSI